ncbi:hypothetical protein Peur_047802 [Populus x canadensis]
MPMMFFHFLKIIFDISTSKRSKTYKPYSILVKKKFQNFWERSRSRVPKHSLNKYISK